MNNFTLNMPRTDTQGVKHIDFRPYKASDFDPVRKLFKVGLLREPNSPLKVGYAAQLRGPTACLSYCALLLGLQVLLVTFSTSPRLCSIGIAFCIAGCALFAALRLTLFSVVSDHVKKTLNGDLEDIVKAFRMESILNHKGEDIGQYVPIGPSGFWVAEAFSKKGLEIHDKEVIGFVGLVTDQNSDDTSAELRHLVVSPDYSRRNVARSLIQAALQYARYLGVTSVVLSTTMFQPAAIALYEEIGWVCQKKTVVRIVLDRVWVYTYHLDLTTAKI